jgi:putative SOS response-associated peptidase YedK
MCGRLKTPGELNEIKLQLQIEDLLLDYAPRYNVPPTALVPVVTSANGSRQMSQMRWGLIPSWAKDDKNGYATFNARADTVASKPAFRAAWKAGRRCLIIADGFYEWRKADKQPYFIALGNRQPMTFAGLWEEWQPPDGPSLRSCTIITTDANTLVGEVHDRMPVIIGPENWAAWLGEERCDPAALLKPFPPERMTLWPVSKRVGNVKNSDAGLIERVEVAS